MTTDEFKAMIEKAENSGSMTLNEPKSNGQAEENSYKNSPSKSLKFLLIKTLKKLSFIAFENQQLLNTGKVS